MNILENIIRRVAHRIGWQIGDRVENAVWSVAIGLILLCCCLFSVAAVFIKIFLNSMGN